MFGASSIVTLKESRIEELVRLMIGMDFRACMGTGFYRCLGCPNSSQNLFALITYSLIILLNNTSRYSAGFILLARKFVNQAYSDGMLQWSRLYRKEVTCDLKVGPFVYNGDYWHFIDVGVVNTPCVVDLSIVLEFLLKLFRNWS